MTLFVSRVEIVQTTTTTITYVQEEKAKPIQTYAIREAVVSPPRQNIPNGYIEELVCKYFTENCRVAVAVATAESGLSPTGENWKDAEITGYPSMGVFQINGPTNWNWSDLETNIKRAREMYLARGWNPWSQYKNGNYKKYLKI